MLFYLQFTWQCYHTWTRKRVSFWYGLRFTHQRAAPEVATLTYLQFLRIASVATDVFSPLVAPTCGCSTTIVESHTAIPVPGTRKKVVCRFIQPCYLSLVSGAACIQYQKHPQSHIYTISETPTISSLYSIPNP